VALGGPPRVAAAEAGPRYFEVTASRYQFQPSTLEVNEGDTVRLILRSTDTTHGFGIKELKVETLIPKGGAPVLVEFLADRPGTFEFTCTEYCGAGHRNMRGTLIVSPRPSSAGGPPLAAPSPAPQGRDDMQFDPVDPDFTVVTLPTTLRLPRHRLAFRLTHRFNRPLGQGDFGDLAGDLFGLDAGAQIGLEVRFGLFAGTALGIHRTSDRTIEFFLNRDLVQQGAWPVGLALVGSVEGGNNFKEHYSPGIGLVVSRKIADRASVYAFPAWIGNTDNRPGYQQGTLLLGLGARVRLLRATNLVGEFVPRLSGFKGLDPATLGTSAASHVTFGLEQTVGGHAFQLDFSNSFATTYAQIARGGSPHNFYIGFNLTRRFF
jgi:cytochrome c oxidase subunit 2